MLIDFILEKYGKIVGLLVGYGWILIFMENDIYYFVDFVGLIFRKEK